MTTTTCNLCRGSGYRRVVLPSTVRSYLSGGRGFIYTGSIACTCRRDVRPHYDAKKFCLAEAVKQADLQAVLLAWIEVYQCGEEQDADEFTPMNGHTYEGVTKASELVATKGQGT